MSIGKLFDSDPFEFTDDTSQLFIEDFRRCALTHYAKNDFFRFLWERKNIHPQSIGCEDDLQRIPFIPVSLLKSHRFITGDEKDIVLTLGSSGTSGHRSQIFLNQESLDQVKKLAYRIHDSLGITSQKKYNYLCFTYDPNYASELGTAFTDELLTSFTDKNEVHYAFEFDGEGFGHNPEKTIAKLKEFEESSFSTRILGFPAFLFDLLDKHKLSLNLGSDSWVQTGGGWKDQAYREIEKKDFRSCVSDSLGIPKENIRDLFGMVEHGIPYVDDSWGRLRIPNYARVLIRGPKTLDVLPLGSVGLIQFICSYNSSFPAISLLTTDYGKKQEDERGEYLVILGRAGRKKYRGCALQAIEELF